MDNSEVIEILKQKQASSEKKLMVRIPYEDQTCLDFEYVPLEELITRLESGSLKLNADDIQAFVELDD